MSQETNLNVAPYFDDFDANNDYYKVLFKPGYPVQARELTTLQSILQNQIEKFGQHFFKEGAKVIPGNTAYSVSYYCVQLENNYLGVPLSDYIGQIIGSKITGLTSGVTAVVNKIILSNQSDLGNTTLYISYLGSNSQDNSSLQFSDGELLTSNIVISSSNTIISEGESFASTIPTNSTSIGSAFSISNGVYFAKGQFLNVNDETILLDQYSNTPSYRVGLLISENVVNSDIDSSLNDNSKGFNNYTAPGADRLKITTSLFKKSLDDFDDNNFIELATVSEGILRSQKKNTNLSLLNDELARRTYSESGDYYVTPFDLSVKESLNNNLGNRGIFDGNQLTYGGSVPSEDLALYQVSPGKAFVRGYEIETISSIFLDVPKPRTTKTLKNQSINYETGSTLKLNRVYGAPTIGIGNTYILSLRNSRVGVSSTSSPGKEIGVSRVYDFKLDSGSYNSNNQNLNEWNISLYDIQTISEITLNEPITLSTPKFIKGKYSGATAFLKNSVSAGTALTVYEKVGEFIKNEPFIFDGIEDTRISIAVTSYGISDIKSVFGIVGSASTFSADVIQTELINIGIATISAGLSGISTIISTNSLFPGKLKPGNLLKFSNQISVDPVFVSVVSVGITQVSVSGVSTVIGVCQGGLPGSVLQVTDLKIISTNLQNSASNSFYTELPKNNISNVDLTDASLSIRRSYNVNILNNQLSINLFAGANETFLPFDPERYLLIRSDGRTEVLTSDKISLINGSTELQIYNLGSNDSGAILIVSLKKIKPKSKNKIKNRVNTLTIDKSKYISSGIGLTSLNDGLIYGNYPYGTRVQDENLSLNVADIIEIHGIYESTDTSNPSSPTAILSSITGSTGKTSDIIIGELFTGQISGASAICAERLNDSKISFIVKNNINFKEGEILVFNESKIEAIITTLDSPSINVSFSYTYSNGQNASFYNYGSITRKPTEKQANKKLKIYFSNGFYQSTDDGDITTADSYSGFDFIREIQTVDSTRNTDIIDIRSKVSDYVVSEYSRSPFEFYGRIFNSSGNSALNILCSNESIVTNFSFYLGRIDRIYLTKDGKFQIKYGTPEEKPEKPVFADDSLEIASVSLPPYLYSVSQASLTFLEHKRYRMVDIKQLENRIRTLEYYTALSLLETNTTNLFIPDSSGLNRFKSGFFVDNFTSLLAQENKFEFKNSIDIKNKELRPQHYTDSIDLIAGPVENVDPNRDLAFTSPEGTNIKKTGDIVTLNYSEIEWLKQTFATRSESVTPFLVSFWQGSVELTPASDTWVDTVRIEAKIVNTEGNFAETLALASRTLSVDPQTGLSPTIWNSWETTWTGQEVIENTRERSETTNSGGRWGSRGLRGNGDLTGGEWISESTTTVFKDTLKEVRDTGVQTRTGTRTIVTEQFDKTSVGDRTVSRNLITFMRSRNIQFVAKKVKPSTQLYAFFDGTNVTKYCVPKLLEIQMISGVFSVGETVTGRTRSTGTSPLDPKVIDPKITFRVAQSNHKEGVYNSPSTVFTSNPYSTQQIIIPSSYSSTSTIINIDTFSLSNQPEGGFSGFVSPDMILVGQTSGAQATISNVRLISDISATLIGSLYIPNPNLNTNPRFETGNKVFTLVNNNTNDQNSASTIAEEGFISSGTLETVQENIISVRNARVENKQEFDQRAASRTTGTQVVATNVISSTSRSNSSIIWYDPLAQSFLVDDETGVFLTKCDVFFRSKDDLGIPVTFQLRTMQGGLPTQKIIPFSEIILDPSQVNISTDGSIPTTFIFKSPVYLEGGIEYCMCLASLSTKYSVYISRIGENDLLTQTFISNQPYLGSLFKSQNASTWEPSQWEDLKFTLYRANFVSSGSINFYNPEMSEGNNEIATLMPNSLNLNSRKIRVGLGSTLQDSGLKFGNTILQKTTNATGNYVGNAGIATGTLNIINSGIGYTPSSGTQQFNSVPLTNITGNGRNAKANITITNGVAVAATISESGSGYSVGNVLGIGTIGANSLGLNAKLSIVSIASTSELILDNVQGDFVISGVGKTVQYINNSGITTNLNNSSGGNVQISEIDIDSDGLHVSLNHKNHGMYFNRNHVNIYDVQSDIIPTKLSTSYNSSSTSPISVDSVGIFTSFENIGIATTNLGYILIGDEIISYSATSSGVLGGQISRGIDSSIPKDYPAGTAVYKYELGGVSLRRINKTHNLENVSISDPITFDSYNIKLDMGSSGIGRSDGLSFPKLYVAQTKSTGGSAIKATQNIPFEIITPVVQNITIQGTSISAEIRTISGSSISGNEIPFIDQGFESVALNKTNYLTSPRIICSKINETNKLGLFPGNKSMSMRINLVTTDSKVTPVIDMQRISTILTSNRVNSVITDYITDNRVNSISEDPTSFQYLSKEITLENPASSLKIFVSAHVNLYSNIRAFYAISETQNFVPIYTPFPGYNNLNERGQIIDVGNNDGLPDVYNSSSYDVGFTSSEIEYKEYVFTENELPSFKSYRIKIIMTSTNQVYVPRMKDLRVIALA
jgi:hypothetical protein